MLEKTIPQTQRMFDEYGHLNGDNDILHYDEDFAKKRGFRGTLGHGLMYTGYVADLAAKQYGRDWHYRGELTVKFVGPVCPGDELKIMLADDGKVKSESQFCTTLVGSAKLV